MCYLGIWVSRDKPRGIKPNIYSSSCNGPKYGQIKTAPNPGNA